MTDTDRIVRDLEKAAYGSRWRDGTLDLCGGLGVLFVGFAWQIELFWLPGFGVPVLLVLWTVLRKRVVEPRIGRVTFGAERRERVKGGMKAGIWLGAGLFLFIVALYLLRMRGGDAIGFGLEEWISALPVALLGLMALSAAAMAGLPRFLGYAGILLGTGFLGVRMGLEPAPQILAAGAMITLIGGVLFFRFIAGHAVPSEAPVEG